MSQPELNIGTIGHVDHGKSTLTWALTGHFPDTHSEEIKRGITIKLGYADFSIKECDCPQGKSFTTEKECKTCKATPKEVRKISIVDAPGHETLMATVIAASSIMDGALFVIAANEKCPQPQTQEHLMVLEASGIKNVVVIQNKIDLVTKEQSLEHYKQIKAFLKGTIYENAPIVPMVANSKVNISALLQAIQDYIPTPKRENDADPVMYVARSFDVNKPGTAIEKLAGGVLGGSIVKGQLKIGDEIEVLPGALQKRKDKEIYVPIRSKIVSLHSGGDKLETAGAGGLLGVATQLDPALSRADSLAGSIVGKPGKLPPVVSEVILDVSPLPRQIEKFQPGYLQAEPLVLGIGTTTTVGFVASAKKNTVNLKLKKPIAAAKGQKIAVMRRAGNRWHLFATAKLA
ncbi:MAG TPA: translation initiation factor IF-2 subunit gamma [Candidatus Norongarragalinales archaeon]|jgi:translation initiation factor 2 subunit 3|nr:translation initiation factor IF-2 subunit gamma [Candidatus Norongarragalinales archaeon]